MLFKIFQIECFIYRYILDSDTYGHFLFDYFMKHHHKKEVSEFIIKHEHNLFFKQAMLNYIKNNKDYHLIRAISKIPNFFNDRIFLYNVSSIKYKVNLLSILSHYNFNKKEIGNSIFLENICESLSFKDKSLSNQEWIYFANIILKKENIKSTLALKNIDLFNFLNKILIQEKTKNF